MAHALYRGVIFLTDYYVVHLPTVVDKDAKEVVYNDFVDINVAVASERGFVV